MVNEEYSVLILKKALRDIEDIIDYYEALKEGRGKAFYDRYKVSVKSLQQNPFIYQEALLFIRRAFIKKTPYHIYYAVDEQNKVIEIVAVLHEKRDPMILKNRINLE